MAYAEFKENFHPKSERVLKGTRQASLLSLHLPRQFLSPTHEFDQDDVTLIVSTLNYFFVVVLHIKWQSGLPDNLQQRQKIGKQKRLAFVFLALYVFPVHIFSFTY